jgi:hypothetical protein
MLIEHHVLEPVLVPVHTEPMFRCRDESQPFLRAPMKAVVQSDTDEFIAGVSERYSLITNRELFSAVDIAAESANVKLDPRRAQYRKGWTKVEFLLPGNEVTIPGDASPMVPTLMIWNGYGGVRQLEAEIGAWRFWCSNGARVGVALARQTRLHVGAAAQELGEWTNRVFMAMQDQMAVVKLMAEVSAMQPLKRGENPEQDIVERLIADVAKKHQQTVREVVSRNLSDLGSVRGDNVWGLVQGIAEAATHSLPVSATYTDWADRWTQEVLAENGVYEAAGVRRR